MLQLPSLQLYTANAFCSYFGRIYNFIKSYQSFLSVTDLDDVVSIQTFITKILKVFRLVSKNKIPGQKLDGTNFNYHNHVLECLVLASKTICMVQKFVKKIG